MSNIKTKFKIAFCHLLILSALSLNAQRDPDGIDISYGDHPQEKLDYWIGATLNSPVVILTHGGAWRAGDKGNPNWIKGAQIFYDQGYAVVNINHIWSIDPAYTGFPQQSRNVACALAWVKENEQNLNGDNSRIILFGSSSGAHLSSFHGLTLFDELLDGCSYNSSLAILGVVTLSGAYDFDLIPNGDSKKALRQMLKNNIDHYAQAQPIEQVKNQTSTKFLILHGEIDEVVGTNQPFPFGRALLENGYCVETTIFEGRKHDLMQHLDNINDPVRLRVLSYVDSLFNDLKCIDTITSHKSMNFELPIYPNPAADYLIIKNNLISEIKDIYLYDLSGKLLIHKKAINKSEYILDISELVDGIYVTQVLLYNNQILSKKLIKFSGTKNY